MVRQWMWLAKEWQAHKLGNTLSVVIGVLIGASVFVTIGLMGIQFYGRLIPILENPSNVFVANVLRESDSDKISRLPSVKRVAQLTYGGEFVFDGLIGNAKFFRNIQYQDKSQLQSNLREVHVHIITKMNNINYFLNMSERHAKKLATPPAADLLPLSISFIAAHDHRLRLGDRVTLVWSDKLHEEYFISRIEPFDNFPFFYVTETPVLREFLIKNSPFDNEMWYSFLAIYSEHPENTREEIESILGIEVPEGGRGMAPPVQTKDELVRTLQKQTGVALEEEREGETRARIVFISIFAIAFFLFQRRIHLTRRKMYGLLYAFGMRRGLIVIQVLTEFFLVALVMFLASAFGGKIIIERLLGLYVPYELFLRYSLPLAFVMLIISLLFAVVICFCWLRPSCLIANLRGGNK